MTEGNADHRVAYLFSPITFPHSTDLAMSSSCFNHLPNNPDGSFMLHEQPTTENAQAQASGLIFLDEMVEEHNRNKAAADTAPPKPPAVAMAVPGGKLARAYIGELESALKDKDWLKNDSGSYKWELIRADRDVIALFPNIGDQDNHALSCVVSRAAAAKRKRDGDSNTSSKRPKA